MLGRRPWLFKIVFLALALAGVVSLAAVVVQLESGAVDVYEPPKLPACPDGREAEVFATAVDWGQPPRIPPVSIHQVESEYYRSFRARTEREWDELKATLRAADAGTAPARNLLGTSRAGPFQLQKQVFGFHPYWEGSGYTNYTFDLLSTVAYFSYDVNPTTGYAITMNSWSNTPLVEWAHSNGTKVVLCATLFSGHSTFFGSASAQSNLISELIRVVQLRNADGVNIDFEGMYNTSYRAPFTAFMSNLATRMHVAVTGSQVSVCLPAVDWYNVFDVAAFNGFLDQCVMMGYDYYWRTAPNAGPVAPLKASTVFGSQCVGRSISNYLAAGLSPSKLLLGVPYYGYEWPTVSTNYGAATTGSGTAKVYSVAISRAGTYGRGWDTNSLTPYYMYGSYVQGWFEDTNSLSAKYNFVLEKNLGGVGIWALGYDDAQPELWDLLADTFATTSAPPSEPPVSEGEELTITPEPSGALSNIVVYCSAGHGFYANTNSGGWYTGRALTNGVVEDIGNVDQLNFLVQYLLNAGATVVPFRPVGYQTNEVVLDNDDAGVTFTGTWHNSSSTIFFGSSGDTPYRYAYISTNAQTAAARYVPNIPVAGFYPVYTWVLHSGNRVRQLYRIRHSGGVNEIRVNHRRVGAGWVWLGTYYFNAGTNGYVEISNEAPGYNPSSDVVIADAVRFGNGMGDVNRGWGVSGYERELEASRYWIQRMVGQGMPSDLYDRPTLNDNDDNVGAPARMADYMDNEADGTFWDRIYLGLHSNADGGSGTTRGPMGLYSTGNSAAAQARQQAFGLALARAITNDFYYLQNGVGFNDSWANNSADSYGAVYGEISEGYNSNMNSTIIEVAYHNNVSDARLLKDPSARLYFARSCLKGLIRHLNSTNPAVPLVFPPDPPTAPCAVNVSNGVLIAWQAPQTNTASGGSAASYRVYRSSNGYGFGSPVTTTNTAVLITNLTEGAMYFFRVTALNAGGESWPSEVVGVRVSPMGRAYHLVVNGFTRFDRTQSPTRYFSANINGSATLVRPRQINSFDYVVQHGLAIAAVGRFFDSCGHMAVVSNRVPLTNYHAAYWILGEESTTNETFSTAEQSLVQNYLNAGGNLFVSGAELGWDLDARGTASDRTFLTNVLKVIYVADDAGTNRATGATPGIFNGAGTFTFDDGSGGTYQVDYPDVLAARGGSVTALVYGASASGSQGAALQYSNVYRLVVMGFPFETITSEAARTNIMARTLAFFGDAPEETPVLGITSGNATVSYETVTTSIAGTNNAAVVGWLFWTNTLTGDTGSRGASASWTITNIALDVGTNSIVVRGTNAYGVTAADTVLVVRSASSGGSSTNLIDEPFDTVPTAPAGWTFSGVSSYTTASASGRNPPSVKFDSDGDWISTKMFSGGSNLSFFIKAYPASGTNSVGAFVVEQLAGGSWSTLLTLTNPVNVGVTVHVAIASSVTQLQFTWNKTSGNIAFDDVIVSGQAVADSDGDGMPDWWEEAYFGGPTNAAGAVDSDGDGHSNYYEYLAGTDPTDAASAFIVYNASNAAPGSVVFAFHWPSATGRVYAVRVTTNLHTPFVLFTNNIPATPPVNVFTDSTHTNVERLYYDVRVTFP